MNLLIPISVGELIDKITILSIKKKYLSTPEKLSNVERELNALSCVVREHRIGYPDGDLADLGSQLLDVNHQLWLIEDEIRECERSGDFGQKFIELARSVYRVNDQRAELKRDINKLSGSELIEEKSYAAY